MVAYIPSTSDLEPMVAGVSTQDIIDAEILLLENENGPIPGDVDSSEVTTSFPMSRSRSGVRSFSTSCLDRSLDVSFSSSTPNKKSHHISSVQEDNIIRSSLGSVDTYLIDDSQYMDSLQVSLQEK